MSEQADLQYPIGRFKAPETLTPEQRKSSIEILAALPQELAAATSELTGAQLDTPYRPGGWSICQLVHHIADSHLNAYARMRLAITQAWPTIFTYDQQAWAELADAKLPPAVSLQLLESLHQRWVTTLNSLPETAWSRGYLHPENGPQRLDTVLEHYAWHSRHHLAHIVNCRTRRGWL